ncbi:MAG: hypothetical protein MUC87_02545 [Bacteroidia bacterium]|jgi:hypothetical protein|nr:hypothetical protein [Bacteroidia bacterium]
MITPDKKIFTPAEVEVELGGYIKHSQFNSLTGTLEKAPFYISQYGVESSNELKLIKREEGLQIQIIGSFNDHVNFILRDEQIVEITWGQYQSDRSIPRLSGLSVLIFILLMFIMDRAFNDGRIGYLALSFGLILGMLGSLFLPISRKKMVSILANVDGEHVVLILSNVRKYEFKNFFQEYYPDISWNGK